MVSHFHNITKPIPVIGPIPGASIKDYKPPKYNEGKSITYKKSYDALSEELLYARIIIFQNGSAKETVRLIKDQQNLIQIVREFDKLKSTMPKEEYKLDADKEVNYVVTMWREGTSVSYVISEFNSVFYYRELPIYPLKHMPKKLVELLGFNSDK
jgi:hypothetical protein